MESDNEMVHLADAMAMRLVGERYYKRDLVNLVRWLIMDNAKTVNGDLQVIGEAPKVTREPTKMELDPPRTTNYRRHV
jgi:hypothetical protein